MLSRLSAFVFSEPSGRRIALLQLVGSLVFVSIYVYYGVLGGNTALSSLAIGVGFAVSALAESLPADRRRAAGGLRLTASLILVGLLALTAVTPEFVVGPR